MIANPAPARPTAGSFVALLLGAISIGFAPIFVRLSEVGPVATAFWRLAIAVPVLCIWAARGSRHSTGATADGAGGSAPAGGIVFPGSMILAGLFFAGDLAVWHWSIHFTSVTNATLLANFAPVWVVLFGWLVFGQRVTRRFFGAMLVALLGVMLLVGTDFGLQPQALLGDAMGLITAVFYGGYLLSVKQLRADFSTSAIMASSGLVTLAALLPVAWLSEPKFVPHTSYGWSMVAALALISHVCGQSLIAYALARLPAAVASVGLMVQPVTAALAAATLLGERISGLQILGMALVLAGVFAARQRA